VGVARAAGTEIKMTSEVLRSLERKGLIEREVDPADTRAKRLRVTERGAELAPRAIAEVEAVDAEFFKPLGKNAVGVLERLAGPPPASGRR
jgi:DNA-binding MarR family transcriptional regulator